ncbi:attachment invasion locus protein, partial [Yersinia pestis PY-19]
MKNKTTLA